MIPGMTMDLSHTPGINYALAYWISCMLFIRVLPNQDADPWVRRTIKLVGLLLLTSFMMLTDGINVVFFVPCMITDAVMMLVLLHTCCDVSWLKAGYFTCRAFMLGEFAAAVEWQVYYYLCQNRFLSYDLLQSALFLVVSYAVVFGLMYLLERRYREGNARMNISARELTIALTLTVSVYTVSNLSYVYNNTPFSGTSASEIFIIRSLVDLGGVGILFALHMEQHHLSSSMEVDYLQKLLAMQRDNYRINEESVRLINQKYHDLKHQIALLKSGISNADKLASLDQMEKEIRIYEAQNKTGNTVLDTILTAKSLQCQRDEIGITCTADGQLLSFMQPMDISVLFGNALDNAIESVSQISDREKRLIHLTVSRQKSFVRIRVENCFEGEIRFENGIPKTTKQDQNFHGFGIRSIRSVVDKYDGSMTICAENGWFELRILFSLPADNQ